LQPTKCGIAQGRRGDDVKERRIPVLTAGVLAVATWAAVSSAESAIVPPVVPPLVAEQTRYQWPNNALLGRGLFVLLASYAPSVIVAVVNDNSYDKHLYIPVLGPWLDLADRPGCGGSGQTSCGTETAYKALLIVVGAFQGLGALATVTGLALPERVITSVPANVPTKAAKATVHVLPAQVSRDGYGLAAVGTF
jgi:hypothetical protein